MVIGVWNLALLSMDKITQILQFWFEGVDDNTPIDNKSNPFKKWFTKDEKFDREIKEKFEAHLIRARWGQYREWESSIDRRLAITILFDQFSRNMFRNTPRMFENDPLAVDLTLRSINEEMDKQLLLIHRIFLYTPLMHSEERRIQELSIKYFGNLVEEAKQKIPANAHYYEYSYGYAQRHQEIIQRFGRFPHRNKILGRTSTREEIEFLRKPDSSF